ncbi:MAG: hypothetical protein H0T76_21255 [Nannocystis sp.]|nr:hypothetical protein [Nannocystis sp.]MBA3549019.1 hypothetical protein [Nannocystis sp.]
MQDAWTTVRYLDGYTRDVSGNSGRVAITVWPDGRARVEYRIKANSTLIVFERALAAWVLPELLLQLRETGFPALPKHKAGPHDRMGLLSVATATGMLQAWILPAHRQMPAVNHSILLLEAIASALSGGSLVAYGALERPVLAS